MALLSAMAKIHMNLLHLSDMHFGPRHWLGNNKKLLEKMSSDKIEREKAIKNVSNKLKSEGLIQHRLNKKIVRNYIN